MRLYFELQNNICLIKVLVLLRCYYAHCKDTVLFFLSSETRSVNTMGGGRGQLSNIEAQLSVAQGELSNIDARLLVDSYAMSI